MKLKTFQRGVHPSYNKEYTNSKSIETGPIPKDVVIPLQQHIGQPCKPLVAKKDIVEEGQVIGEADAFISAPVHATVSGKVKDVDIYPHPSGGNALSVVITCDGERRDWEEGVTDLSLDLDALSVEDIRDKVRAAGIVGLGGAAFPTSVKLSPPKEGVVDTVLLNGCECEPYLSADHRLMVEFPERVLYGMKAIMKSLGASRAIIGVEDNKQDAIDALLEAAPGIIDDLEVVPLETKYPQGAEKMLIHAVLGRVVPVGKLPFDVGVVVNNTHTAFSIYEALKFGKPLMERIVTISGNGVKEPKNMLLKIGTKFEDALNLCGGIVAEEGEEVEVINGGPMMGIAQTSIDVPVVKGLSGITILTGKEIKPADFGPCIRCASCVDVCPMALMPYKIADMGRLNMELPLFDKWGGMACIECGCCSFVCPSKRPLLQWIRVGKFELRREAHRSAS